MKLVNRIMRLLLLQSLETEINVEEVLFVEDAGLGYRIGDNGTVPDSTLSP